jgi:predicted Zn finger-like uncharacterized protein
MSLSVQCPHCAQRYRVDDSAAGRKIECPKCHTLVAIPSASVTDDLMPPAGGSGIGGRSGAGKSGIKGSAPRSPGGSGVSESVTDDVMPPAGGSGVGSRSGVGKSGIKGFTPRSPGGSGVGESVTDDIMPPPGGSGVASRSGVGKSGIQGSAPRAPGGSGVGGGPGTKGKQPVDPDRLPPSRQAPVAARPTVPQPAPVVSQAAPPAQPIAPPSAAPIAVPIDRNVASPPTAHADAGWDGIRADAVAEILDEQDRDDRDYFRGVRRRLDRPPSIEEMIHFVTNHKLVTVILLLSLFIVGDYLRTGQLMLAFVFTVMTVGLTYMGTQEQFAAGALFQSSAWCYLIVLCVFPFVLEHRKTLESAGAKMFANPKQVARQPAPAKPTASSAPAPTAVVDDEPSEEATSPAPVVPTAPPTTPDVHPAPAASTEPSNGAAPVPPPAQEQPPAQPTLPPGIKLPIRRQPPPATDVDPADGVADLDKDAPLRQHADKAFAEANPEAGLDYLYAEALVDQDSEVWRSFRWSQALGRPVLALRWGAAVEPDDIVAHNLKIKIGEPTLASKGVLGLQRAAGTAFVNQTQQIGGDLVVRWLHQNFDEGRFNDPDLIISPNERALRGASYLWSDTPAEVMRAARAQRIDFLAVFDLRAAQLPNGRTGISATFKVIDVAAKRELHASKARLLPTQAAAFRKDIDTTLDAVVKELTLTDAPSKIDRAGLESRVKAVAGKKSENVIPVLAELGYYLREKRLSQEDAGRYTAEIVGDDKAKTLLSGNVDDRRQILMRLLSSGK